MSDVRPPFPSQEGNGNESGQTWQQPASPYGSQPSQAPRQPAFPYGSQAAQTGRLPNTDASQQQQGSSYNPYERQTQQTGSYGYGSQAQAGQTQVRQNPTYGDSARYAQESDWSQSQQGQQQASHYASQPTAEQPAKRERRGGGAKSAVLGLVFGMLGAAGTVLAMQQFGLVGNTTTVVTENAEGKTVAITASAEDSTIAKAVSEKVLPSVVSVHVTNSSSAGLGSGVILDTDGYILTNNHVAGDATAISVTIDGKSYDAELVGTDASSDLAVIKANLDGAKVTPIDRGDSDALVVGDWVMTVGSPFGLDQSVSAGIVSSLARNELMTSYDGNTLYANLIQVDAAINPGNSGGALVNEKGELVGIPTLFSSDTESFAGIGFAIPGNYALDVAEKIIAGETVTHAYIGLSMQTVNAQNAARNNLPVNQGAYVAEVAEGGPAAEAGIQVGDIITAVNGKEISSADGMILSVRSHKIGETVKVTLMRGKEEMTIDVTLGSDEALQAQQQKLIDEQQTPQVDGLNGYTNEYGTTDSYGQRDILDELYQYLYNNRGGSYEIEDAA